MANTDTAPVPWQGGKRPIPANAVVEITVRGVGKRQHTVSLAGNKDWRHIGGPDDILFYKVLKMPPPKVSTWFGKLREAFKSTRLPVDPAPAVAAPAAADAVKHCLAYQASDSMVCPCGNIWDMNDPTPPECGLVVHKRIQSSERIVTTNGKTLPDHQLDGLWFIHKPDHVKYARAVLAAALKGE